MGVEPWYTINFLKNVNTGTLNLVSTKGINKSNSENLFLNYFIKSF